VTTDLVERYGAASPGRRRWGMAALGLVIVLLVGWLAWTTLFHANPPVTSDIVAYDIVDDNEASAVVSVSLEDGVVASCRLQAYADDHSTVGELAFEPVDGRNEVTLRTERRATTVTLVGCTAPGQSRPR